MIVCQVQLPVLPNYVTVAAPVTLTCNEVGEGVTGAASPSAAITASPQCLSFDMFVVQQCLLGAGIARLDPAA